MRSTIKKATGLVLALAVVVTFVVATSGSALAGGPTGYEGQPGNQGNGTGGYEGQPGNQGGPNHH